MNIVEEVERRRLTVEVEYPKEAYSEIKDLLENRMTFDHVHEEKYYNDVDGDMIRVKIETEEGLDGETAEELEIFFKINKATGEVDIQVNGKLVTEYPDERFWQESLWYYAYRSLYDKFLYGSVREGYEPAVEEKMDTLVNRLRETLEA
ncbi:MAG: hypothetical protein ABEJ87_00750 [Candidatus Nanohalobium sp.]